MFERVSHVPQRASDFNIELMTASAALFPDMRAFPTFWVISNPTVAISQARPGQFGLL
jgi:hypothetical protein